jgi:hypothetical protein
MMRGSNADFPAELPKNRRDCAVEEPDSRHSGVLRTHETHAGLKILGGGQYSSCWNASCPQWRRLPDMQRATP